MEEEGVKMIESLDSVWFFSNVFSTTPQDLAFQGDEDHGQEVNSITKLDPSKPIIPILETRHTEPQIDEIVIIKSGDLGSQIGKSSRDQEQREEGNFIKKSKRRINKGIDHGFDMNEFWMMMEGYEMVLKSQNQAKMMLPPFDDGMAMKKHLKSWAYAIACNVR